MAIELVFTYENQRPRAKSVSQDYRDLAEYLERVLWKPTYCESELHSIRAYEYGDEKQADRIMEETVSRLITGTIVKFCYLSYLDWQPYLDGEIELVDATGVPLEKLKIIIQEWRKHLDSKPVSKRSSKSKKYTREISI